MGLKDDSLLKRGYKFVVQKGQEPYFERKSWDITADVPVRIYLDSPRYASFLLLHVPLLIPRTEVLRRMSSPASIPLVTKRVRRKSSSDQRTSRDITGMSTPIVTKKISYHVIMTGVKEVKTNSHSLARTISATTSATITRKTLAVQRERRYTKKRNGSNFKRPGLQSAKFSQNGGGARNA